MATLLRLSRLVAWSRGLGDVDLRVEVEVGGGKWVEVLLGREEREVGQGGGGGWW